MKSKIADWFSVIFIIIVVIGLIFGAGWCQWKGYKDRFPNGGCLGFITQHR